MKADCAAVAKGEIVAVAGGSFLSKNKIYNIKYDLESHAS